MGGGEVDFTCRRDLARGDGIVGDWGRRQCVIVYYFELSTLWPLLSVLVVEAIVLGMATAQSACCDRGVDCNAEGLLLFSRVLERLEREPFASQRLCEFAAELKQGNEPASRAVRKFARLVYWIDASDSLLASMSELPFLYSVQVGMAAEAWRRRWGAKMRRWTESNGRDGSAAFAGVVFLRASRRSVPGICGAKEGLGFFDGEHLGHPLIAAEKCVRNSVRLDATTRVLLVSGSNMSGKSTFLARGGNQYGAGDGWRADSRKAVAADAASDWNADSQHGLAARRAIEFFHGNSAYPQSFRRAPMGRCRWFFCSMNCLREQIRKTAESVRKV